MELNIRHSLILKQYSIKIRSKRYMLTTEMTCKNFCSESHQDASQFQCADIQSRARLSVC